MNIKLNNQTSFDLEKFMSGKLLLQANTGGGKSHAIRRITEQLFGKIPIIILDTEGEFATLRQKFDFILIGKGQDIVADHKSAALLAHRLIQERVSAIIDLLEMSPYEREMFVRNFVEAMTNAPKNLWLPTLLIVDEAQTYAPEGDHTEVGRILHDAAFKFRKRHFGIIFATPRISVLSKNVISTCRNKLIGYTSFEGDMKRAAFELGFTSKEQMISLRDLDPGEFFAFGPAISKDVIKIKMGDVQTIHGDETDVHYKVAPASPAVKRALAKLADLPAQAKKEAQNMAELRSENTQLRKELATAKKIPGAPTVRIERVEIPTIGKRTLKGLLEINSKFVKLTKQNKEFLELANKNFDKFFKEMEKLNVQPAVPKNPIVPKTLIIMPPPSQKIDVSRKIQTDPDASLAEFGLGERKVLNAIAQTPEGINNAHLAILTGYKITSRRVYLNKLKSRGYIEMNGDNILATSEGVAMLGNDFKPLPTGQDLRDHLLQTLPEGEKKIFAALLTLHPDHVTKEQIMEMTGYKITSTRVYLNKLAARKVIEFPGGNIKVADKLFN